MKEYLRVHKSASFMLQYKCMGVCFNSVYSHFYSDINHCEKNCTVYCNK